MVYPSGYLSSLIHDCCSWEKRKVSKSKVGISLVLIFFTVKNNSLLRCEGMVMLWISSCSWWKTFFIVSQRCSNWICLISSASLFHSCISSQQFVSGFCTFCSALCDLRCHEEEISLTVQPEQRWRAGLQCTRHCTNYSKDRPWGPQLGGGGEWEQVEAMGWFVAGGVRQRNKSQGSLCFWFLFLLSYCVWIMDTVHSSNTTDLGIAGAFSLSYYLV